MNSHLRAIRTLPTPQHILDGLLVHIVTWKLDQRTREKWEEDLSITELSTWDAMESFFGKEVQDDGKLGPSLGNSNNRPAGGKKLAQI